MSRPHHCPLCSSLCCEVYAVSASEFSANRCHDVRGEKQYLDKGCTVMCAAATWCRCREDRLALIIMTGVFLFGGRSC